ncbi:hypothetical protein BJ742DRAFT_817302 [Cladochytrium replicatum]|nr:hypothetical protein BJ742DRAFT_817302 [Cladochytrium replicatum]
MLREPPSLHRRQLLRRRPHRHHHPLPLLRPRRREYRPLPRRRKLLRIVLFGAAKIYCFIISFDDRTPPYVVQRKSNEVISKEFRLLLTLSNDAHTKSTTTVAATTGATSAATSASSATTTTSGSPSASSTGTDVSTSSPTTGGSGGGGNGLSSTVRTALIAVGAVLGFGLLAAGGLFIWNRLKKTGEEAERREKRWQQQHAADATSPSSYNNTGGGSSSGNAALASGGFGQAYGSTYTSQTQLLPGQQAEGVVAYQDEYGNVYDAQHAAQYQQQRPLSPAVAAGGAVAMGVYGAGRPTSPGVIVPTTSAAYQQNAYIDPSQQPQQQAGYYYQDPAYGGVAATGADAAYGYGGAEYVQAPAGAYPPTSAAGAAYQGAYVQPGYVQQQQAAYPQQQQQGYSGQGGQYY